MKIDMEYFVVNESGDLFRPPATPPTPFFSDLGNRPQSLSQQPTRFLKASPIRRSSPWTLVKV